MRLHRFYTKHIIDKGTINSFAQLGLVHQLSRVFRLHSGDKCIFFDGSGNDYVSEIVSMHGEKLEFKVLETKPVKRHSDRELTLAVSLVKKDNFEWVVQKGTELGVSEFIPVISERSEKKSFNMERAQKIMIEAVEQSGRSELPTIGEPVELPDFVQSKNKELVVFHISGEDFSPKDFTNLKQITACVGPEGGWSDKEIEMFKKSGARIVKLNTPVLRAETAAVSIATLILAQ